MIYEMHLGDCLIEMPRLGIVDHIVCDPPYSDHVHASQRRKNGVKGSRSHDLGFGHLSKTTLRACCEQFARLARKWVLVFSDLEGAHYWREGYLEAGLRYVRTMIWHRSNAMPQLSGDRPAASCEAIVVGHHNEGRMLWNGGGGDGHFDGASVTENRAHETEKPLWLMEVLVALFCQPGELVLDPFAGVGTTGVACKRAGVGFIGYEIDLNYFTIASSRIQNAQEQLHLFNRGGKDGKQEAWR